MKRSGKRQQRLLRRVKRLFAVALAAGVLATESGLVAAGTVGPESAWARPSHAAMKKVAAISSVQSSPNLLSNLDCDQFEYRRPDSGTMQSGCFTQTAFGALDSDSGITVFNGTDEGLPLLPYSAHQVLVPWPNAQNLLTLDSANTGGSYVGMYKSILSVLLDRRSQLGKLTAKQLGAPPDMSLLDPNGSPLVINPQTMAFSSGGAWLVAETLNGAFVRVNLATLDVVAFAPAYNVSGSPALLKSQVSVSGDGNVVAVANDAAGEFKVYDLTSCGYTGSGWQSRRCAFHDYMAFAKKQTADLRTIRHVRFINEKLLSFEIRTGDYKDNGVYELSPEGRIGALIDYLALGDSYTSGEGAFDYLSGTDTADNTCHISASSYPLLLSGTLFGSGGHSVACSGARVNDVGNENRDYRGQMRQAQTETPASILSGFRPGYVAQHRFVRQYQPGIVTVSVGGNDVGFGDIIRNCVTPHVSLRHSDNDCYSTYEDRVELLRLIDRTVPHWAALYKQLAAESPGSRLYVIGYPQIVSEQGSCGWNVHLGKNELKFAEALTAYLNDDIRRAAAKAGAVYVDISQALAGYRLCEAPGYDVAVNGLTVGRDGGPLSLRIFDKESYHPNALGQELIEQAVLKQTRNLAGPGVSTASHKQPDILSAPKTGRQIYTTIPAEHLTESVLPPGKSAALEADGALNGLRAFSDYTVRLGGITGRAISTAVSNGNGDIATGFTVPAGIKPGGQTIDIIGQNLAGEPVDLTQPVYISVSGDDTDGDGVSDNSDSCPGAVNSGRDTDHDGKDDTCDSVFGPAQTTGKNGGSSAGSEPETRTAGNSAMISLTGRALAFRKTAEPSDSAGINASTAGSKLLMYLQAVNPARHMPPPAKPWLAAIIVSGLGFLALLLNRRKRARLACSRQVEKCTIDQ